MAYIKSRSHAAGRHFTFGNSTAMGLVLAALPGLAAAQQVDQAPTAPPPSTAPQTMPSVKVRAAGETGYKTEQSASPKATAALVDTPQTVTVIKEQIIREQAATTLTQALRNTPGVGTFFLGENGSTSTGDAIYIRGSDASNSIFVDGIRDLGSVSRDTFNIAQIEVLKGAAGFDIGRGAATGAINIITKQPDLGNHGTATAGLGSAAYQRGTLDVNRQVGDHTAVRLNLVDQDSGVAGRDHIKNRRKEVAPSAAFGLGTSTRLFLNYLHIEQDNVPDGGVFTIGLPGYSAPDKNSPAQAARTAAINAAPRVRSANFYGSNSDHDQVKADMFTSIFERDLDNGAILRNTSRYGKTHENYQLSSFLGQGYTNGTIGTSALVTPNPADRSTWTLTRNMNNKDITNDILTNQTNLSGMFNTWAVSHSYATGVELTREEQLSRAYIATTAANTVSVYDPNASFNNPYTRSLSGAYTFGKTATAGVYAVDTVTLTPHWLINGGLRFDHYTTTYNSYLAPGATTPRTFFHPSSGNMLSGKGGLLYKPTDNSSVYASYAVTKLPPGGSNFTLAASNAANVNNPDVSPQVAKTSEVGGKWDALNKQLVLTAALYRTTYSDQITVNTDGTSYRTGQKRVQGVELGATGNLTPLWTINTGFTTMFTKVEGTTVTSDGSTVLAYNPTKAFTLWSTYKLPAGFTVGGGTIYNGELKRGSDSAVGTPAYVSSYWVFNGMALYKINKVVELQLNLTNLFNRDYVASINKSGYRYTPGSPRSGSLQANISF